MLHLKRQLVQVSVYVAIKMNNNVSNIYHYQLYLNCSDLKFDEIVSIKSIIVLNELSTLKLGALSLEMEEWFQDES